VFLFRAAGSCSNVRAVFQGGKGERAAVSSRNVVDLWRESLKLCVQSGETPAELQLDTSEGDKDSELEQREGEEWLRRLCHAVALRLPRGAHHEGREAFPMSNTMTRV
jgi:hypothetical protein